MDQATLVKSDRIIGAKVIEALSRTHMPISIWDWVYVPQLEEWQLIIGTSWVDAKGLRTTYRAVTDALQKAKIYSEVPMRRLVLKSPSDPQVKAIEREVKEQNEGFVHILKHQTQNQLGYSVVFAPIAKQGSVPMRSFWNPEDLRDFLSEYLALGRGKIEEALHEVNHTGATSIFPVTLTARQIKNLGL